jgi:hypothetical protein
VSIATLPLNCPARAMSFLQNAAKWGLKTPFFVTPDGTGNPTERITIKELIKYLSFALLAGYLLFIV